MRIGLPKFAFSEIAKGIGESVGSSALKGAGVGGLIGGGVTWAGGGDPLEGALTGVGIGGMVGGLTSLGRIGRSLTAKTADDVAKEGSKIFTKSNLKKVGVGVLDRSLQAGVGTFNILSKGMGAAGALMPSKTTGFALGGAIGLGAATYGAGKAVLGELTKGSMSPYGDTMTALRSPGVLGTNAMVGIAAGGVAGSLVGAAAGGLIGRSRAGVAVGVFGGALAGSAAGYGLSGAGQAMSLYAANKMHTYDQRATAARRFNKNSGMSGPMSFSSGGRVSGGHLGATGDLALSLHANRRG